MIKTPSENPEVVELMQIVEKIQGVLDKCGNGRANNGKRNGHHDKLIEYTQRLAETLYDNIVMHINSCSKSKIKKLQSLVYRFAEFFGENTEISMTLSKISSYLELRMDRILEKEALESEKTEEAEAVI